MVTARRDPQKEAALLRASRSSLLSLEEYFEEARLRGPARTAHKALVLLDFIRQVSRGQ